MSNSRVHPAVQVVRDFNREADQVERECRALEQALLTGRIDEAEFDRQVDAMFGGDEPDERNWIERESGGTIGTL